MLRSCRVVVLSIAASAACSSPDSPAFAPAPSGAVAARAVDLGTSGHAAELPDGTIVHVGEDTVTCLRRGARTTHPVPHEVAALLPSSLAIEPRTCEDLVVLAASGELVVASGARVARARVPLSATGLALADDGALWLTTTGPEAFGEQNGAWRSVRWSGPTDHDRVVAITREALFVRRASDLLRVALPYP